MSFVNDFEQAKTNEQFRFLTIYCVGILFKPNHFSCKFNYKTTSHEVAVYTPLIMV